MSAGVGNEIGERLDDAHARMCGAQLEMFRLIADVDRKEGWRDSGARDMAHWLSMRYGISDWKARRWIAAAHALRGLPRITAALAAGRLGPDKVIELTRIATADTEADLIPWAREVSNAAVRRRADRAQRRSLEEVRSVEEARTCSWWFFDDGKRFGLSAELPAAQGAAVARAIERIADRLPVMPGEEDEWCADARRADALVALASARLAADPDAERSTVVVHASLSSVKEGSEESEIEGGGIAHPETVRRLLCSGRVQVVIEDEARNPVWLGRMHREPPAWMMRQLRYRDSGCRFPGCGTRAFANAHHVRWWSRGGSTELENLILICSFHHRLVHEYGWSARMEADGRVTWFQPDGARYRAGPAPPGGAGSAGRRGPAGGTTKATVAVA